MSSTRGSKRPNSDTVAEPHPVAEIDHKTRLSGSPFEAGLRSRSKRRRETLVEADRRLEPRVTRNDTLPRLELIDLKTEDLSMPARNARAVEEAHIQEVIASISTLGFCDPVLIDNNNCVLDGVARVLAAKRLNLTTLPCIRASHLTASERRLLRLALNRLGEKGTWAFEELKLELNDLVLECAPVEVTGFSAIDIDQIGLDAEPSALETGPLAPEPDAMPVAQRGDVFSLGEHIVVCGDATDPEVISALMADQEARIILTDQPYNVPIAGHVTKTRQREFVMASGEMNDDEFRAFNESWLGASVQYLCEGGLFGTFIDWRGYPSINATAVNCGLTPINLIVWVKNNGGMGSLFRSQHELLPFFKKGKARHVNNVELGKHGRWRSNVWRYPGASCVGSEARSALKYHPTVKPVAMLEDALLDVSKRDDIVLDPFLGSGTTLIAAEKTGRRCRGTELDALYVDVTLQRYEAVTGRPARLKSTGETHAELAMRRKREAEDRRAEEDTR